MKEVAKQLRMIAKMFEKDGKVIVNDRGYKDQFSCNVISALVRDWDVVEAYRYTFGFLGGDGNEDELWKMDFTDQTDMRILMLCFAAAMAETGDLK